MTAAPTARVHVNEFAFHGPRADYWLPTAQGTTRPSTWDAYRRAIDLHVLGEAGAIPLQKLSAHDLDRYDAQMRRAGRVDGAGGLSAKTVRNIHNMLHEALHDAERKQLVTRNVATSAHPLRHDR
ncbi:MAG: hypothetical protein QM733_15900 [Ilumatobacteraceae bacterium]